MTLRTWHLELLVAACVVVSTTALTAHRAIDWLACLAVLASFCHGQVAARMSEAQGALPTPTVDCYRIATVYWVAKEALWLTFFVLQGSYAAVCGCLLFAVYPAWRRWWRSVTPRSAS